MDETDQDLPEAVRQIRDLVAWTGDGRALTKLGRLTRADARVLVDLLDTGDEVDYVAFGKLHRLYSSTDLLGLMRVLSWAKAAGLVRVLNGRLVAVKRRRSTAADPARLSEHLFTTLSAKPIRINTRFWSLFVLDYTFAFDTLIGALTCANGRRLPVQVVSAAVWDAAAPRWITDDYPLDEQDAWEHTNDQHVRALLECLEALGVVRLDSGAAEMTAAGSAKCARHLGSRIPADDERIDFLDWISDALEAPHTRQA